MGHGSLKSGVAGFCWSSEIANVWVRCCWVSRLLRLVMGLVEIGEVMVRSWVVEMGVDSDGHRHLAISPLTDLSFWVVG